MKFDVFLYTFEGKILIWVSLLLKRLAGQVASESTQALLMIPPARCTSFVGCTTDYNLISRFAGPETQCCQCPSVGYLTHRDQMHRRHRFWKVFYVTLCLSIIKFPLDFHIKLFALETSLLTCCHFVTSTHL